MAIIVQFRRLEAWPHSSTSLRTQAQFRSTYPATIELIEGEIERLSGTDVVVSGFMQRSSVRRDGWPASDSRPPHPGVIVSFRSRRLGDMVLANDSYSEWQANLRGIGLTLDALRAIRRYGTVDRDQQYKGFSTELTPVAPSSGSTEIELAAEILLLLSDSDRTAPDVVTDPDLAEQLFRVASKRVHPDTGGSAEMFQRLQAAMKILRARKAV